MPIDIISYSYILFNLIYITIGKNRVEKSTLFLMIFTLIAIVSFFVIWLYKEGSGKIFTFIRHTYPLFFFPFYFNVSTQIDTIIFRELLDPFFQRIDYAIFGYQPSIEWGLRYGNIILQELFHFAYFSYYIVIPIIAILIYFKKNDYFPKYIFTVAFVFYICYITYSLIPVVGGRYWEEMFELTMTYRGGLFTRIMAFIYTYSQHRGAAFPSSHVAITIVMNLAAYRYSKKFGRGLLLITVLLIIATVYCHYHYFIDSVFGIIYALLLFKPAERLYDYLNQRIPNTIETTGKSFELEAK